jgi:hypothetical protein
MATSGTAMTVTIIGRIPMAYMIRSHPNVRVICNCNETCNFKVDHSKTKPILLLVK